MNTILRWDPTRGTRWNPFKDRDELESRLATLFAGREPGRDLKAGVISFKNLGEGRQWFGLKLDSRHQDEHLGAGPLGLFQEQLTLLLREIFDPRVALRATEG